MKRNVFRITIYKPIGNSGHFWKQDGKSYFYKTEQPARKKFEKLKELLEKSQMIELTIHNSNLKEHWSFKVLDHYVKR